MPTSIGDFHAWFVFSRYTQKKAPLLFWYFDPFALVAARSFLVQRLATPDDQSA